VLSVAAFQILIVSTKPATTVTRIFVVVYTIPTLYGVKELVKTKKNTHRIKTILFCVLDKNREMDDID
jgi:hypothetical protein